MHDGILTEAHAEARRRPFAREGLVGRVAPFATAAVAAVVLGAAEARDLHVTWLAIGTILTALTIGLALVVPWRRLPMWADVLPPLVYLAAVGAIREAAGGGPSGYAPLVLLPVMWVALYGQRSQLIACVIGTMVVLAVPIIVVGDPAYPFGEWRRLIILTLVGATMGLIVQALVHAAKAGTERAVARGRELAEQRDVIQAIVQAASNAVLSFDASGTIMTANDAAALMFGRDDLVGSDVFDTLVPDEQVERLRGGFGRIIVQEGPTDREARFEADLRRADGSRVPVEISVARTDGPTGIRIHAFVRDTTVRRDAERGARDHLADLARLLAVARELGQSSSEGRAVICDAARGLADADFVLFYTADGPDGRLVVSGASSGAGIRTDIVLDPDRSIAGQVLRSGVPVFSGDLAADPRVDPAVAKRVDAGAAYWQPIESDDRAVGVVVIYWRTTMRSLPERTSALIGLFATLAAAVIERSDLLSRLEHLVRTDALTGAANRRALDEALDLAIADGRRSGRPVSVAMLDLDHFKRFNDERGHQAGDDLLRGVAAAWMGELRPGDTLARYGGEEFLAVLVACDAAAAILVADRLRAGVPGNATASAGTATWDGHESIPALIARADRALYAAKDGGRDRTVPSPLPPDTAQAEDHPDPVP